VLSSKEACRGGILRSKDMILASWEMRQVSVGSIRQTENKEEIFVTL
jgi:hypothetical protein